MGGYLAQPRNKQQVTEIYYNQRCNPAFVALLTDIIKERPFILKNVITIITIIYPMDGYTFILKSRLRSIIFHVNKKPERSAPFLVRSRASNLLYAEELFSFFTVALPAFSLVPALISASFLLKEGAKYFITAHKLSIGAAMLNITHAHNCKEPAG